MKTTKTTKTNSTFESRKATISKFLKNMNINCNEVDFKDVKSTKTTKIVVDFNSNKLLVTMSNGFVDMFCNGNTHLVMTALTTTTNKDIVDFCNHSNKTKDICFIK